MSEWHRERQKLFFQYLERGELGQGQVRNSGRRKEWYPDGLESCEYYKTGHWLGNQRQRRMPVAGMVSTALSEEVMFKLRQE